MIFRDEVELVFSDTDPSAVVRVRGIDVATIVFPGLELPRPDDYDGYWGRLYSRSDGRGADRGVSEEGEFLVVSWRNGPDDGPLEQFVHLHTGRWNRGTSSNPEQWNNTRIERTTTHKLIVLERLTEEEFGYLALTCGGHADNIFDASAETFTSNFTVEPDSFAAVRAHALSRGLRFRTETTITYSYQPNDRTYGEFSLDERRLLTWLVDKAHDRVAAEALTVGDLHPEGLNKGLARDVSELVGTGILAQPAGWQLLVWPLRDGERSAYLVTVGDSDDVEDDGVPLFDISETGHGVSSADGVREQIKHVVDTANRLLPLARAARTGTDPDATHHPDGMCKAHGDCDCGEDDCQR